MIKVHLDTSAIILIPVDGLIAIGNVEEEIFFVVFLEYGQQTIHELVLKSIRLSSFEPINPSVNKSISKITNQLFNTQTTLSNDTIHRLIHQTIQMPNSSIHQTTHKYINHSIHKPISHSINLSII